MKRTRQHILEDESILALKQTLPSGWVTNEFAKDYGKDIQVEIFKKGNATGNQFIIQLKATDAPIKNDLVTVSMKKDHLIYFSTLSTPVLLVFYSSELNELRAIWANHLMESYQLNPTQKTYRISLSSNQIIKLDFFERLEMTFTPMLPKKVNLSFETIGKISEILQKKITGWCNRKFGPWLEMENCMLPDNIHFQMKETDNEVAISIQYRSKKFILTPLAKSDNLAFLMDPTLHETSITKWEAQILFVLAFQLIKVAPIESVKLLSNVVSKYNGDHKSINALIIISDTALSYDLIFELTTMIDKAIENHHYNDLQIFTAALTKKTNLFDIYHDSLLKAYNAFEMPILKAALAFNLGNYYLKFGLHYEASKFLIASGHHNPDYHQQYYWWMKLAGVMYMSDHYQFAGAFYTKALNLPNVTEFGPHIYALLGDCYYHQTKFTKAIEMFQLFQEAIKELKFSPSFYYAYKEENCRHLIESGLENRTLNNRESMRLLKEALRAKQPNELYKAIENHPLNYLAWQELGYHAWNNEQWAVAYNSFLTAAVICETDDQLWLRVLLCSFFLNDQEQMITILILCYQEFDVKFLPMCSNFIYDNLQEDFEVKQSVMEFIKTHFSTVVEKYRDRTYKPPPIEIRSLIGVD